VVQTLPSASTLMLCGILNRPFPTNVQRGPSGRRRRRDRLWRHAGEARPTRPDRGRRPKYARFPTPAALERRRPPSRSPRGGALAIAVRADGASLSARLSCAAEKTGERTRMTPTSNVMKRAHWPPRDGRSLFASSVRLHHSGVPSMSEYSADRLQAPGRWATRKILEDASLLVLPNPELLVLRADVFERVGVRQQQQRGLEAERPRVVLRNRRMRSRSRCGRKSRRR
jgi:hypothetical protein